MPAGQIISFKYQGYTFKELHEVSELEAAYRLRHEIVVEKLKWVNGDSDRRLEVDEFDEDSFHFGCLQDGRIVGYVRMTRDNSPNGTMTRKYFAHLINGDIPYPPEHSAEISRFIIDTRLLANRNQAAYVMLGLYRVAFGRSRLCRPTIRYWYFATSPKFIKDFSLRMALPVEVFGSGITSDGKKTLVAGHDIVAGQRRLLVVAPWRHIFFRTVSKHARRRAIRQPARTASG